MTTTIKNNSASAVNKNIISVQNLLVSNYEKIKKIQLLSFPEMKA